MNCLYIDASRQSLRLGLQTDYDWFSEEITTGNHAENLLPLLVKLCETARLDVTALSNVVIINGPGSFTGLRISVSAVHAIDAVTTLMCLPIDQLSAIAQANNWFGPTIIDARMNEAYIATNRRDFGLYETFSLVAMNDLPTIRYLCHEDEQKLFPDADCYGSYSLLDVRSFAAEKSQSDWIPASQILPFYVRNTINWKTLAEQPSKLYDS